MTPLAGQKKSARPCCLIIFGHSLIQSPDKFLFLRKNVRSPCTAPPRVLLPELELLKFSSDCSFRRNNLKICIFDVMRAYNHQLTRQKKTSTINKITKSTSNSICAHYMPPPPNIMRFKMIISSCSYISMKNSSQQMIFHKNT